VCGIWRGIQAIIMLWCKEASLNNMVYDACDNWQYFIHATKFTTSSREDAGRVSISSNKTARFVITFLL
jgi:hypothetical protein